MRLIFSIAIFLVTFSPFDPVNGNPDRVEEYRKMDFKERASPGDHGLNNGFLPKMFTESKHFLTKKFFFIFRNTRSHNKSI